MNRSNQENLALMRHKNGTLTWEVVWTDFISDVIAYLEQESDFDGDDYEALLIVHSDSVVDGPDGNEMYVWPILDKFKGN